VIRWLQIDRVLAIHSRQISEHGGQAGVRDVGLLESALARPQNIFAYEANADLARLAAAYALGIVKNHPFIDGNKRTGYVVMETFLIRNGVRLVASVVDKYVTVISLADGTLTEDDLTGWLRDHIEDADRT
jgi:death-on-curing protein